MIVGYAKAYLTIMNKYPQFKTLYFDGFAGSGGISQTKKSEEIESIKGTAIRILEIDSPKAFDTYYFVEKNEVNKIELENAISKQFLNRNSYVVNEDCNVKLRSMALFMKKNVNQRALVFIDPFGMSVDWESIESLKGLGIDLWILVPTGIGVGRLLKNNGDIPDSWIKKLEKFLGISKNEITSRFYRSIKQNNLFSDEPLSLQVKESNTIDKVHSLYQERLLTVFKYVSDPFVMRNRKNAIMYHFMMATNNPAALRITNDIIKPKYKL
jgi:three-Cys-motif partner protein